MELSRYDNELIFTKDSNVVHNSRDIPFDFGITSIIGERTQDIP